MGVWMREVGFEKYLEFVREHGEIRIEDQVIKLEPVKVSRLTPSPEELTDVSTSVWSFPRRGAWATHRGDYRGNWPPQIPRALVEMFTEPGDVVLDQMVGSGTTLVEARLLGRNGIGVDISYEAVMLTLHRLYYLEDYARRLVENGSSGSMAPFLGLEDAELEAARNVLGTWCRVFHGDARRLDKIGDESVDLIATHPPYFNIIKYGGGERVEGDLSRARRLEEYVAWMGEVAEECFRVLKPGKYCAVLVGDTRVHKHYVPITHYVLREFLGAGFVLKEEVVKIQHKMKSTREVWSRLRERDFLLIFHEKLFIFRKPLDEKERRKYKYSGFLEI